MPRKKLIRVAATRSSPSNRPPVMVAPERETPGTSASDCSVPRMMPSRTVIVSSPRLCLPIRSPSSITPDQMINPATTAHRLRSTPVISGSASSAMAAVGMKPAMIAQPIR